MSEGKQFVRTLHQLGYRGHHELQGESFDWLFEYDEVKHFLQWFCENINEDNNVNEEQFKEFKEIEASGKAILDGKQLLDAIKDMESSDGDMTDDKLKEEIARLRQCKKSTQERKEKLAQQRNVLSMHHTALTHRLARMSQVHATTKQELKRHSDTYAADNMQMNNCLDRLGGNVSDLCQLYSQISPTPSASRAMQNSDDANFLCQVSLNKYFTDEEKFTNELTQYTKKQFFKDIGQIAGEPDTSRYSFLDIGSPTSLILHGENEDVFRKECKELSRLQSEYPASLYRNIKAKAKCKGLEAGLKSSEQYLQALTQNPYPKNESEFRQHLYENQSKLQHVKRKAAVLYESHLPMLVRKLKSCRQPEYFREIMI
ncbi:HAUS augmin-like complex subunit 3 [Ptychodera flava]|uniref:HAUS augmin-like complex subunit 3 n=1 Tax=Ptychodera flava TaxID=63121 RepID=UPI00396A4968